MGKLAIVLIIASVLFIFWLSQMIALMSMKDEEFPGRHDKILWFIAVFGGFVGGALAFRLWRIKRFDEAVSRRLAGQIGDLTRRIQEQKKQGENEG